MQRGGWGDWLPEAAASRRTSGDRCRSGGTATRTDPVEGASNLCHTYKSSTVRNPGAVCLNRP